MNRWHFLTGIIHYLGPSLSLFSNMNSSKTLSNIEALQFQGLDCPILVLLKDNSAIVSALLKFKIEASVERA